MSVPAPTPSFYDPGRLHPLIALLRSAVERGTIDSGAYPEEGVLELESALARIIDSARVQGIITLNEAYDPSMVSSILNDARLRSLDGLTPCTIEMLPRVERALSQIDAVTHGRCAAVIFAFLNGWHSTFTERRTQRCARTLTRVGILVATPRIEGQDLQLNDASKEAAGYLAMLLELLAE